MGPPSLSLEGTAWYSTLHKTQGIAFRNITYNSPRRSKRRVDRLSHPNEHSVPSQFVATLSRPADRPIRARVICIESCMRVWEVLSFVEVNPSVWVAIVLPARQFFVHRCMLLFMLASLIFVKRPASPPD